MGQYLIETKQQLGQFICNHYDEVNNYINLKMENVTVPLTTSVDIREDRNKVCPVDNNLYPAGFNNLCTKDREKAAPILKESIQKIKANAKNIGVLPESHTRNLFYLENIFYLTEMITNAGLNPILISPEKNIFEGKDKLELTSHSGKKLNYYLVIEKNGEFICPALPNQTFDVIFLNHDQSLPFEIDWRQFRTPVAPSPLLGWYARQKNRHFSLYSNIVGEFCEQYKINPCLLQARFKAVTDVDFESKAGLEKLATAVDELQKEIGAKTKLFVKASKGTYGMGINVVSSGEEILAMNRKTRNKMDIGKNNIKFTDILVQEGIETIIKYDDMPAEVTVYLVGGHCVGGFMRANSEKGTLDNLNSKGMVFKKLCVSEIRQTEDDKETEAVYSVVARLSTLAAACELEEIL